MEDLYGDLENYNEVNNLQELQIENKELKLKLEEYETAMGKLQKDYDKLELEFNNLQKNFSSLLKTAKAEVERKAQQITQLNQEKDMMIIQSLQSGNRRTFNKQQPPKKSQPIPKKNNVESKDNVNKKVRNDRPQNNADKRERSDTSSVSTTISVGSTNNAKLNIVDKVVEKVDDSIGKVDSKEKTLHFKPVQNNKHSPQSAGGIKNRRKSMPAVGLTKSSSDDECESGMATKPTGYEANTETVNPILTRINNDRLSNKTSENSSTDGKSSNYQEQSKESPRTSRAFESDKHRDSDRFRESDRYRDTERYRDERYQDNYKSRSSDKFRDKDKSREADKSDRYRDDKYKETDRFRDNDRYKDNKFYDKYRDHDKYKEGHHRGRYRKHSPDTHRYRKHYSPDRAHKRPYPDYQDDYHRPEHVKQRVLDSPPVETHGHYRTQDRQSYHEKPTHDNDKHKPRYEEPQPRKYSVLQDNDEPCSKRQKLEEIHLDYNRRHDKDPVTKLSRTEVHDYETHTSCQSPDAAFSPDSHQDETLEHTVREIKNTAAIPLEDPRVASKKYILKSENGKTTLTISGSKSIDIKPIDMSLWQIESVAVPDALLSKPPPQLNEDNIKEIYMDIDNQETNISLESGEIYGDSEDVPDNFNKPKDTSKPVQSQNLNRNDSEPTPTPKPNPELVPNLPSTYRIPKKNSDHKLQPKISNTSKNIENNSYSDKTTSKVNQQSQLTLPLIDVHDNIATDKPVNTSKDRRESVEEEQLRLSKMAMVQDDLELSDETSDNVDLHKEIVAKRDMLNSKQSVIETNANIVPTQHAESPEFVKTDDKPRDTDSHKKRKRRKTKSKEIDLTENTDVDQSEKKGKSKKDKESKPKQLKNKFTDLFGESSSLITPEDLGIPAACVPLCEDAVDINISEIANAALAFTNSPEICTDRNKDTKAQESKHDAKESPNKENREIVERIIEEPSVSSEVDANVVYQNLNVGEEILKQDVVKTVIISSGVQPQFLLDNGKRTTERRLADVEVNIQNIVECEVPAVKEFKKQDSLKALATSTPHKDFSVLMKAIETDSNKTNNESVNTTGQINQSDSMQGSNDAPDVRIFVRRRRKGVKKP